jgi:hypothetical protein
MVLIKQHLNIKIKQFMFLDLKVIYPLYLLAHSLMIDLSDSRSMKNKILFFQLDSYLVYTFPPNQQ